MLVFKTERVCLYDIPSLSILSLASRRAPIIPVRDLISDASIRAMNHQFRMLIARDFSCNIDCLFLR